MTDGKEVKYDFDLVVLGGGSGGLAAAKEAAKQNKKLKVACIDFVKPSHQGTKWGLGGTCVNVGCIPKKLFHYSGLFHSILEDAKALGWRAPDGGEIKVKHDWEAMTDKVDGYIKNLNMNYRNALKEEKVKYINAYGVFKDAHTLECTDAKGKVETITADKIIIAVGGRPRLPDIPGAELGITSDDIFWWTRKPVGKVLINGAGYIALECAGFLREIGYDVSVMVRSMPLREFDHQIANQIAEVMERNGVRFIMPGTLQKLERLKPAEEGKEGRIMASFTEGKDAKTEEFDTVFFAIGRDPIIKNIGLDKAGVEVKYKIVVDELETTSQKNIFAIGDCALKRAELTPIAIQAGVLLARRLFGKSTQKLDELNIPTTVFTPLEYGSVGYTQETAEEKFGKDNIECFASRFGVLEGACTDHEVIPPTRSEHFTGKNLWARKHALEKKAEWIDFPEGDYGEEERTRKYIKQQCLAKLVCVKKHGDKVMKVIGFHYLGPNAGEVTQGFALGLKLGATKADFEALVGIHPTAAEEFTAELTSLSSGEDFMKKGGC